MVNSRDARRIELLNTHNKKIGDTLEVSPETKLKIVSNESFAIKVVREISTMKYLYDLDGPILYCLHFGIAPENYDECKKTIEELLPKLGWNVRK